MSNTEYNLQELTGDKLNDLLRILNEESLNLKEIEIKNLEQLKEARSLVRHATQVFDESTEYYALRKRQASQFLTICKDVLTDNDVKISEEFNGEAKLLCDYLPFAISTLQQLEEKSQSNQIRSKQKISAKFYALHYLLECKASNNKPPTGEKNQLEKIGFEKYGIVGNTFYKMFSEYENKTDKQSLRNLFGSNWIEIIQSINPTNEQLNKYLKNNYL